MAEELVSSQQLFMTLKAQLSELRETTTEAWQWFWGSGTSTRFGRSKLVQDEDETFPETSEGRQPETEP